MEIDEIRVIVCEGQNLKGKKKDHCRASVIFGIGNDKFRTTIVDEPSGNVLWNEEQTFDTRAHLIKPIKSVTTNSPSPQPLHRSQFAYKPLIFTVKDKERIIGRVTQPLDKLSTTRKKYRCPLIPPEHAHSSELGPTPHLVYECWITKYRAAPAPKNRSGSELCLGDSVGTEVVGRIKAKTNSLTRGGLPPQSGAGHSRQISSSSFSSNASSTLPRSHTGSSSRQTAGKTALITSVKSFFGHAPNGSFREARASPSPVDGASNPFEEPSPLPHSSTNESLNNISHAPTDQPYIDGGGCGGGGPLITGISPMQGPTTGATKITVRGQELGRDRDDIVGVYVCGVDCSATLKHYSPAKITLVTPSGCPAGSGEILIVTRSGGASRCTVKYRFYEPGQENEIEEEKSAAELLPHSSDTSMQSSSGLLGREDGNYCYGGLYYLDLLKHQPGTYTHYHNGPLPLCNTNITNLDMLSTLPHPLNGMPAEMNERKKTALSETTELSNASELNSRNAPRHFRRFKTTALDTYENCSRESLLKEVYSLRRHVEDLMTENKLMRYYVDTLVLRVMEVCPEHLEKSRYKSTK